MWRQFWKDVAEYLSPLEPINQGVAILGNSGQAITALIAFFALLFAWLQIRSGKSAQREATLRELNRDQNRLSFESPEFAWPDLMPNIVYKWTTIGGDKVRYRKYHQFVIIGMVVCERAAVDGRKREWDKSINSFLRTHAVFIESEGPSIWDDYDDRLKRRWETVLMDPGVQKSIASTKAAEAAMPDTPPQQSRCPQAFNVLVTGANLIEVSPNTAAEYRIHPAAT